MNDTTTVEVLVKEGGVLLLLLLLLLLPLVLILLSLALWRLFRPNILSLQWFCFGSRVATSTPFVRRHNEVVEKAVGSSRPVRCLLRDVVLHRRLVVAVQCHVGCLHQASSDIILRRGG